MAEGIGNLLENKLFLSLLSQGGASIGGEGSLAAGINPVVQKTIAAQNKVGEQNRQMKVLAKLLGAGVDFKSDATGKATIAGNLSDILGGGDGGSNSSSEVVTESQNPTSGLGKLQATQPITDIGATPNKPNDNLNFLSSIVNPSSSPLDTPAYSDLVGLTPQDISESLAGAISARSLKQKIASDAASAKNAADRTKILETQASTAQQNAATTELKAKNDYLKSLNKDDRPIAQKNYEFAQSEEGGGFEGTFVEFQKSAETSHKKDYDTAVKGGYTGSFQTWMLEMAKAGAINLGDITARKEATEDIEAKKFFTDPKGLTPAVDKFINSEEIQNKLFTFEEGDREIETIREKEKFISNRIISSGGKIVKSTLDGRTFVWTVEWPDGDTTEVRYAN